MGSQSIADVGEDIEEESLRIVERTLVCSGMMKHCEK